MGTAKNSCVVNSASLEKDLFKGDSLLLSDPSVASTCKIIATLNVRLKKKTLNDSLPPWIEQILTQFTIAPGQDALSVEVLRDMANQLSKSLMCDCNLVQMHLNT